MLIMVTGVSGSGKSEYAEQISCQLAKGAAVRQHRADAAPAA